jgi:hypothetical protein
MLRHKLALAAAGIGLAATLGAAVPAEARTFVSVGIGLPGVYYAPPPVYYAPPPPPPVYYAPSPVYYGGYGYGPGYSRYHHYDHHDHDRH